MNEESIVKAIGYDVDGTMVDFEPLHVAAWHEASYNHGADFEDLPLEFQNSMAGRKPIAIAAYMVEVLYLEITPEEFLAQKHAAFMEKIKTDLRPMPGVVDSVKRLGNEYALGIGTSLDREYVDIVLDVLGVADAFSVIVTGDEIKRGKPDPETYILLAERMGVQTSEMVVLEDAKSGIESAKSAGCRCIAIENLNAIAQDTSKADQVVHSLGEVTTEMIASLH